MQAAGDKVSALDDGRTANNPGTWPTARHAARNTWRTLWRTPRHAARQGGMSTHGTTFPVPARTHDTTWSARRRLPRARRCRQGRAAAGGLKFGTRKLPQQRAPAMPRWQRAQQLQLDEPQRRRCPRQPPRLAGDTGQARRGGRFKKKRVAAGYTTAPMREGPPTRVAATARAAAGGGCARDTMHRRAAPSRGVPSSRPSSAQGRSTS